MISHLQRRFNHSTHAYAVGDSYFNNLMGKKFLRQLASKTYCSCGSLPAIDIAVVAACQQNIILLQQLASKTYCCCGSLQAIYIAVAAACQKNILLLRQLASNRYCYCGSLPAKHIAAWKQ
jgi:hypothetical protein